MSLLQKLRELFLGIETSPEATKISDGAGNRISPLYDGSQEMTEEEFINVLLAHPIFIELRDWEEFRIKVLTIEDQMKRNMARHYLGLLFTKLREAVVKMVNEHDTYLSDTIALNNLLIDTINDVRQAALVDGVPEIFLDKFTNYLYQQMKILDSTYKDLDRFEYYNTPIARATFRLDLEFLTIRNITSEVESVINEMNGQLHNALEGSVFDR